MANLVGQTLKNRYQVIESLGRGGMAEVYKVWDSQRGVHLAMKVLREDLAEDRVFLRRFQREAENLARLQHPNIVRFYGLEQEAHLAFILMEYIEGATLRRQIFDAGGPLPLDRVLQIMKPVCSALQYAHQMGMLHCDLKSGNIMLDGSGKVYLTDFGIARMSDAATATLVGAGTPAYMAPELVRGEEPTPQTDIYALGVVLYEMLTGGERPFTGERATITGTTAEKVRWEQVNLEAPPLTVYNPRVSPELDQIIATCLAKDSKGRFQDVSSFTKALAKLKEEAQPQKEALERQEKIESGQEKAPIDDVQPQEKPTLPYAPKPDEPGEDHKNTGGDNIFWFGLGGLAVLVMLVWAIASAIDTAKPVIGKAPTATADTSSNGSSAATQISAQDGAETTMDYSSNNEQSLFEKYTNCHITYTDSTFKSATYCMDIYGDNNIGFSNIGEGLGANWSPDGKKIAFASEDTGYQYQISIMDLTTEETKVITSSPEYDYHFSPSWSPDGKNLVYVSSIDGRKRLSLFDLMNMEKRQITDFDFDVYEPTWSPDGNKILLSVYGENDPGDAGQEIFYYDFEKSEFIQLTNNSVSDRNPSWSPDGNKIVFARYIRNHNFEIIVMNADGSNPIRLTNIDARNTNPVWSPSGDYIAFISSVESEGKIMLMNSDGSNLRELRKGEIYWVAWSPFMD